MRQSEKIKYILTSPLTDDELKNVIHYSFSNRPIDTKLWSELLDKLDLTYEDITTDFRDKIKNLVYDAFIIKRIEYDEVSYNLSLLRAKKYIEKYTKDRNISDLIKGWLLYTSTDKSYFYPNAWKEPEQNKILDFFNITSNQKTYRNDDLTLMFCVYVVSNDYKRKNNLIMSVFEPSAKLMSYKLKEAKVSYNTIRDYLIKLTKELYCMPMTQSTYNLIEEINDKIYYYVYISTDGNVTTKLHVNTCDNKISLSLNFEEYQSGGIKNTIIYLILELLKYDIEYFNTYGYFFNSLYS